MMKQDKESLREWVYQNLDEPDKLYSLDLSTREGRIAFSGLTINGKDVNITKRRQVEAIR